MKGVRTGKLRSVLRPSVVSIQEWTCWTASRVTSGRAIQPFRALLRVPRFSRVPANVHRSVSLAHTMGMKSTSGITTALFLFFLVAVTGSLGAQQAGQAPPAGTPRPEMSASLQQQLLQSGLTPDQIRERLARAGYSPTLLDQYMPGSRVRSDSLPSADVMAAMRLLMQPAPSDSLISRDSVARTDSIEVIGDSAEAAAPSRKLALFGLDLFRRNTTQFDASQAGVVDASYRVGPRDVVVVLMTGGVELSHALEVTRDGFIVVPQVGQVFVSNLTLGQVEDVLYRELSRRYSSLGRSPNAATKLYVTIGRTRTNQVFVIGDVKSPGSYQVSATGTALTALYRAGGPTENGSFRSIEIRRGGRTVGQFDLYDYLLRGDASKDVRLENGDIVFVPVHANHVSIVGEVVRPGIYEMRSGETLSDLVRAAGGFRPEAARRRVQIIRIVPPSQRTSAGHDRIVVDVSPEVLGPERAEAFPILPGDSVRVFAVNDRVRDRIVVAGNVWSPGSQAFTRGMTLSEALARAGGVKPDVQLSQILISRVQPDLSRVQLRASLADTSGRLVADVPLQEDDSVRVFSRGEFMPTRYVYVSGAVRKAGYVPFREGMTLRDLLTIAGGLREDALLKEVEVARIPEDRGNGRLAVSFRVPMDSTYLLERGPDGKYLGPPGLPAATDDAPEFPLKPYDNVLVFSQPNWALQPTVYIGGEVRFPGRYTILTRGERITDLIDRAGGFTDEAFPEGVSYFNRRLGRIDIDLPKALEKDDSITVARYRPIVKVEGAVNAPVVAKYISGLSLEDYVRAAGGFRSDADMKRAYVTQPNGRIEAIKVRRFQPDGMPKPKPGSTVTVPIKPATEQSRDLAATVAITTQIIAAMAAVVALVRR
jgi:polysaccharide biosynthesis/export protein